MQDLSPGPGNLPFHPVHAPRGQPTPQIQILHCAPGLEDVAVLGRGLHFGKRPAKHIAGDDAGAVLHEVEQGGQLVGFDVHLLELALEEGVISDGGELIYRQAPAPILVQLVLKNGPHRSHSLVKPPNSQLVLLVLRELLRPLLRVVNDHSQRQVGEHKGGRRYPAPQAQGRQGVGGDQGVHHAAPGVPCEELEHGEVGAPQSGELVVHCGGDGPLRLFSHDLKESQGGSVQSHTYQNRRP
mmetsp:Transcript_56672/g.130263  ORF Transcript_56672/g.130263 Transcript_56672/m.130263 type:complete len:241 (-) Transcript_56672:488-1210(-)